MMQALQKLGKAAKSCGMPQTTLYLVILRASQINGCSIWSTYTHASSGQSVSATSASSRSPRGGRPSTSPTPSAPRWR